MSDSYTVSGYEVLEKTVSPHGASGHIYLPKGWIGATVKVIRTTPIGSDLPTAPRHELPRDEYRVTTGATVDRTKADLEAVTGEIARRAEADPSSAAGIITVSEMAPLSDLTPEKLLAYRKETYGAAAPWPEPPHYDGVAGEKLRAGDLVTVGDDGRVYRAGGPRP